MRKEENARDNYGKDDNERMKMSKSICLTSIWERILLHTRKLRKRRGLLLLYREYPNKHYLLSDIEYQSTTKKQQFVCHFLD